MSGEEQVRPGKGGVHLFILQSSLFFLCIENTFAAGKMSFSKLQLIKSYLYMIYYEPKAQL